LQKIRLSDPDTVQTTLGAFQQSLYGDFVRSMERLQSNLAPTRVGLDDIPADLKHRYYNGARGLFLLQIHPSINIWDRDGARSYVTELHQVDPKATGTPVITYESIRLMERAYRRGAPHAGVLGALLTPPAIPPPPPPRPPPPPPPPPPPS